MNIYSAAVIFPMDITAFIHTELYALAVPLLAPSVALVAEWEAEYHLLEERTVHTHPLLRAAASDGESRLSVGDPYDYEDRETLKGWLAESDLYTLPHVEYFDSLADLVALLDGAPGRQNSHCSH